MSGILLLCSITAEAVEPRVSLYEKQTGTTTAYAFDAEHGRVRKLKKARGEVLPRIESYRIESRNLCAAVCLIEADEILFQGRLGDTDVVVVRKEYNSFSDPLRWLAAESGHPVQVSSIRVVAISAGRLRAKAELTRRAASYHWTAVVVD